eukprot:1205813-Rhodomonas_salina.2
MFHLDLTSSEDGCWPGGSALRATRGPAASEGEQENADDGRWRFGLVRMPTLMKLSAQLTAISALSAQRELQKRPQKQN